MQLKIGNNNFIQTLLITLVAVVLVPSFSFGANASWELADVVYSSLSPERQKFANELCDAKNGLIATASDLVACFKIAEKATNMHKVILPRACSKWSNARNPRGGEFLSLAECAKSNVVRTDFRVDVDYDHDHVPGDNCSLKNPFGAAIEEMHKEVAIFGSDNREEAPLTGNPYSAMGTISCLNMQKNVFKKATAVLIQNNSGEDIILTTAHSFGNIETGDLYEGCMFKSRFKSKEGKDLITTVGNPLLGSAIHDGGWTGDWAVAKLDEKLTSQNSQIKPLKIDMVSRERVEEVRNSTDADVEMIAYNNNDNNISRAKVEFLDNSKPGDVIYNSKLILTDGDANGGGSGGILYDKTTRTILGIYSGRKDNLTSIDDSNVDGSSQNRRNNSNVVVRIRAEIVQAVKSLK